MATTTPNRLYPYPNAAGDPNRIPADLQALAEAIDTDVCQLLLGVVGRPVARVRGTGVFQSQSAAGIGGNTINRVPWDTIDFDPFGLLELQDQTPGQRLIRITQPGYYMAFASVQIPTFTTAGVTVNYLRWQLRQGLSSSPATLATRLSGHSNNIPTNADDGNVKILTTAAGAFFNGTTHSYSVEFQAVTSPNTPSYPINERTLTIMRMTQS
jgi:hypothetical protein